MWPVRIGAIFLVLAGAAAGYFVYSSQVTPESQFPFKFGLDLVGGSHLVYEADTSALAPNEVDESMAALRDVIERRVNLFGVAEPIVQVEKASVLSGSDNAERLIVELPGIEDIDEALGLIGATPVLEFKLVADEFATTTEERYSETGLTGRYLTRARLEFSGSQGGGFGGVANEAIVLVDFNTEGRELFGDITTENVGRQLAIFLDGELVSDPVIREPITGGTAVISGGFTPDAAKELVRELNIGALPVPISLLSTQIVGASLGAETLDKGVKAGMVGLALVAVFMLVWYRVPGLAAVLALSVYLAVMLSIFKLIPVTLTAAGIAGFILSLGMAVDANVLIFERMKEELKKGNGLTEAVRTGFERAWAPIRDGNLTSLISAVVLFWFGTSVVEGFALVFGIGIIVSMLTALSVSRTILLALASVSDGKSEFFGSGFKK